MVGFSLPAQPRCSSPSVSTAARETVRGSGGINACDPSAASGTTARPICGVCPKRSRSETTAKLPPGARAAIGDQIAHERAGRPGLRALRSFETPGWRLHAGFDSRSSGPRPRPSKRQRPPERAARGPRQRRDLIWHVVLARKCLWRWPCRSRWRAAAVRAFRRCPRSGRRWSRFRCQGHDTIPPTW